MGALALSRIVFFWRDFLASLNQKELLLYLFFILASDRNGLSYYSYDSICTLLQFNLDEYIAARDGLIEKDLIAFDGILFQVLSLPSKVDSVQRPNEQKSQVVEHMAHSLFK